MHRHIGFKYHFDFGVKKLQTTTKLEQKAS